MTDEIPCNN